MLPQNRQDYVAHLHLLTTQHDPRLEHIQRRRNTGSHRARNTPVDGRLPSTHVLPLALPVEALPPARVFLEGLPHGELDDGEGHLAQDGDAPPAVQLPPDTRHADRLPQGQDGAQRRERRAAMLAGLGALFDDFGGDAHGAGGNLAETGGDHVVDWTATCPLRRTPTPTSASASASASSITYYAIASRVGEKSLGRFVGAEEEGGAGRGAQGSGADAPVDAAEAARGEEAFGGLEAGLEGVEGEEGQVDCGAGYAAGDEGRREGRVWGRRHFLCMCDVIDWWNVDREEPSWVIVVGCYLWGIISA